MAGVYLVICISSRFPGDADAAAPGTTQGDAAIGAGRLSELLLLTDPKGRKEKGRGSDCPGLADQHSPAFMEGLPQQGLDHQAGANTHACGLGSCCWHLQ